MASPPANEVDRIAERLRDLGSSRRPHVLLPGWWNDQLLAFAVSHPSFKTQLFRFVDVFPATEDDADVLRHLEEYFGPAEVPKALDLSLGLAEQVPFGGALSAAIARRAISRMARQFIVGADANEAVGRLRGMWEAGSAFTVDLLGEKTVTDAEADAYLARVDELLRALLVASEQFPERPLLEYDDLGRLPRVSLSVKPTALSTHLQPLTAERGLLEVLDRLSPVLERAVEGGAYVHLDMEHYDVKDLTLELLARICADARFSRLETGITIQSYLKDARHDLATVIELSAARATPLTVRLVKGAYWDTEGVQARAEGWPVPVFSEKAETDASFEECTRLLLAGHGKVRAAFGSHNLESLAFAVATARELGIGDDGYEVQMLYGMAEPFHEAVRRMGLRLRVYAPVGELVPGMAYLVRRLLENTANESFVRAHLEPAARRAAAPHKRPGSPREAPPPGAPAGGPPAFHPEPPLEWRKAANRASFSAAVGRVVLGGAVPAVIGGTTRMTQATIDSLDPACTSRRVATSADCGPREADEAVAAGLEAFAAWSRRRPGERAEVLFGAASWMRARRLDLAALEVYEAGKPWADADADVCEAIDYCEYYAREMLRLSRGAAVDSPPGELNALGYQGRGVGVVIAPWNFPLAIPTGMVTAALVTGNAVVLKPAEQTPLVASQLVEALRAGGLPPGVLGFLPGTGEVIGPHLVAHRDVSFIAFTGSKKVGLEIIEEAAVTRPGQRHVKRTIAEMGGKNAIVIDADADLDQAVPITVTSAFGYSGQKCSACSRVIVVGQIYEEFLERLVGAAAVLTVGHPEKAATQMGPLIDADAHERVRRYVAGAPESGSVVLARSDVPDDGFFVGPTVVRDVLAQSPLWTDEIFGPVLSVRPAGDIEEAVALANDSEYALTAGVVSRSPAHVAMCTRELRAGNVYVNRPITGAVVGRQPFGGYGLSGVGAKAGGPDYLLQFVDSRAVSENTLRQGLADADWREWAP